MAYNTDLIQTQTQKQTPIAFKEAVTGSSHQFFSLVVSILYSQSMLLLINAPLCEPKPKKGTKSNSCFVLVQPQFSPRENTKKQIFRHYCNVADLEPSLGPAKGKQSQEHH